MVVDSELGLRGTIDGIGDAYGSSGTTIADGGVGNCKITFLDVGVISTTSSLNWHGTSNLRGTAWVAPFEPLTELPIELPIEPPTEPPTMPAYH